MKTIYKFPLEIKDHQIIDLPKNAEIISVQVQSGNPVMWAILDPNEPKFPRVINTYGTGHNIPEDVVQKFIGTYQVMQGTLVFHVFEVCVDCV